MDAETCGGMGAEGQGKEEKADTKEEGGWRRRGEKLEGGEKAGGGRVGGAQKKKRKKKRTKDGTKGKEDMPTHSNICALENLVDRRAWQATVHGVTKSGT